MHWLTFKIIIIKPLRFFGSFDLLWVSALKEDSFDQYACIKDYFKSFIDNLLHALRSEDEVNKTSVCPWRKDS